MKTIKNFITLAITAVTMLASLAAVSAEGEWYTPYTLEAQRIGIQFSDDIVTNDEFITALLVVTGNDMEDMTAIQYAKLKGYVAEQEMTELSAAVTRQTMAKVVSRVLQLPDGDESFADNITDWEDTCPYCKPYILKCYSSGIITGYEDGSFRGRYAASTNEVAAILVRAYNYRKEKI